MDYDGAKNLLEELVTKRSEVRCPFLRFLLSVALRLGFIELEGGRNQCQKVCI